MISGTGRSTGLDDSSAQHATPQYHPGVDQHRLMELEVEVSIGFTTEALAA